VRNQGYTVQLGAFAEVENAERLARQLKDQGYVARVSKKVDGRGRVWHIVRVGQYPDKSRAEAGAAEIARKLKINAVVRPAAAF
jgi:cell division septation protein DedD